MAGNVQASQAKNVQVNLEQKLGNTTKLGGLGNTIKQYAAKVVVAAALVAGAGYAAGCGGEASECCQELNCGYEQSCNDHYDDTCACVNDPSTKYQTQEFGLTSDDVFENDATTYDGL
ncbi:hypothetical protein HOC35_01110 [Candidatus Woesearchaeota archaeon]|jgi:hypothetical protein|nr:hypothetical protein [Candidatus Woesearchaeota archaeon]